MSLNFFHTATWQLIKEIDFMGWVILLGLMAFSVFCIAVIAFKCITFKQNTRSLNALLIRIRNARTFSELITISKEFKETLGGRFLILNLSELKAMLDYNISKKKGSSSETNQYEETNLTVKEIEQLEMSLAQTTDNLLTEEEAYLPMLSTSAAAGPLIGLFGTIWGLIRAFVDISQEKSADIATVAPGMAVALVATLAGLIVAIPSLIAYHYLANRVKLFEKQLDEVATKFMTLAKQTFVK